MTTITIPEITAAEQFVVDIADPVEWFADTIYERVVLKYSDPPMVWDRSRVEDVVWAAVSAMFSDIGVEGHHFREIGIRLFEDTVAENAEATK